MRESTEVANQAYKKTIEIRDKYADAIFSKIKGTVQKRKPNLQKWKDAILYDQLFELDLTRTLSSSFAEITFADLNQFRLNENSQALFLNRKLIC